MKALKNILYVTVFVCGSSGFAFAQDSAAGHDMASMGNGQIQLPEICKAAGDTHVGEMSMGMNHAMDEAHMALMDGMEEMNKQMMTGMMAEDIDVAFVCGMIPHHQSAVNMAKAELAHGDDEWAKDLAQKVIDAQQEEISDMLTWLEERAVEEKAN